MKEKCNRGLIVFVWWNSHLGLPWLYASTNNFLLAVFLCMYYPHGGVYRLCSTLRWWTIANLKLNTTYKRKKIRVNLCSTTTSFSDVWAAQFIAHSDWLVEEGAGLMTKETGNGHGVDMTWWVPMPPLISSTDIPPRTLEGGVAVGRQLKVTAHCHSTVQSHYTSRRLRSCLPSSHDGQMTIIPALLFHAVSSSLGCMCFWFCSHLYLKKCQIILLVKVSKL